MSANQNNDAATYSPGTSPWQEESIIAAKIYDQCRLQECVRQGPAVSGEDCVCTVVHPVANTQNFGCVIYPGEPVRLPKWIRQIKYVKSSFRTREVTVLDITPSAVGPGYWDVRVRFAYDFELRLCGKSSGPLEIICQNCVDNTTGTGEIRKDFLRCTVTYTAKVTLLGPGEDSPIVASDILPQPCETYPNAPHALVETRAEAADFRLIAPEETGLSRDLFDDTYHEPFNYIYAFIAVIADIKLFGPASLIVQARRMAAPASYQPFEQDPCQFFAEMPFPTELFKP